MRYLTIFFRWLFEAAVFLTVGFLSFFFAFVMAVIAGVTALTWFFFGWLGGILYLLNSKLYGTRDETDETFTMVFRWHFINQFGIRGPLYLAEAACVLGFALTERLCTLAMSEMDKVEEASKEKKQIAIIDEPDSKP